MKERPSWPMKTHEVRAIKVGTKTQHRIVVKPQPIANMRFSGGYFIPPCKKTEGAQISVDAPYVGIACPHGQSGDRLWLRETHAFTDLADGTPVVAYAADACQIAIGRSEPGGPDSLIQSYQFDGYVHVDKWRPSIHMPRWASRITLEVTGVRVERLQDISEADAIAEGCEGGRAKDGYDIDPHHDTTPQEEYRSLWESINGPGSCDKNPWVWVVEFKRIEGDKDGK